MKNSSRNYSVMVAWDAGSGKYVASCLEAPACAATSADRMEAIRLAYRAVDQHIAYGWRSRTDWESCMFLRVAHAADDRV